MGNNEPRRFSYEMLIRMDERLTSHTKCIMDQVTEINRRISLLESFRTDIEKPVHAAGWILITFIGAFVIAVAGFVWQFLTHKIRLTQ